MNKIYTKNKKLVIEIPLKTKRYNPYLDKEIGEMDNVVGLIIRTYAYSKDSLPEEIDTKMGFAYNIDMLYKGKMDQETDFFYVYDEDEKDFVKLCRRLKLEVREINIEK